MYAYNHHCLILNMYIYIYDHAPRPAPRHENTPRYIWSPSQSPKIFNVVFIYIYMCVYITTTV